MKERKNSRLVYEESCCLIPGGVNSPVRSFASLDLTPLIVERGRGDTIWDIDGHSYVDYCCSWGALILGHAFPSVIEKAINQVALGSSFGIATRLEKEIAARLVNHLPALEKVRFVSSGTEAAMSVLRLARGYTGRSKILKFNGNYHGHVDALLIQAGSGVSYVNPQASSKGIPEEVVRHTISLPFNDVEGVREFLRSVEDLAAVIIEPVAGNMGVVPATMEFLQMLREETRKKEVLLIFDEVITGFRVGLKSAQGFYGIAPDLACFGKIIGGGFPAAAFGGRKEIMDHLAPLGEVYQAGTLSGNPVAMAAGLQTLIEIDSEDFYRELEEKTNVITVPVKEALMKKGWKACVNQQGSMFTIFFGVDQVSCKEDLIALDHETFRQFFIYLFERGIYISPSPYEACFVSKAHSFENLFKTRDAILDFVHK
jgi:glutamate-1-semialdehyde 2,1-aminomutase